jgi:hypothetical protein
MVLQKDSKIDKGLVDNTGTTMAVPAGSSRTIRERLPRPDFIGARKDNLNCHCEFSRRESEAISPDKPHGINTVQIKV